MAYTPPDDQIIVMTKPQLWELVAGLIIDNNIMQVTPYKVRAVLNVMIASLSGPVPLTGLPPITVNQETGVVSIGYVSTENPGILSSAQYISLLAGSSSAPLEYGVLRVKIKAEGNAGGATIEENDIVTGWVVPESIWETAQFLGGDPEDLNNYKVYLTSDLE
jgi:hypothetical protein